MIDATALVCPSERFNYSISLDSVKRPKVNKCGELLALFKRISPFAGGPTVASPCGQGLRRFIGTAKFRGRDSSLRRGGNFVGVKSFLPYPTYGMRWEFKEAVVITKKRIPGAARSVSPSRVV
jgi:hypothetical protein